MPEQQKRREALTHELRAHELAMARLAIQLRQHGERHPAESADAESIFMSAQILRHQIRMALIVSRLSPATLHK